MSSAAKKNNQRAPFEKVKFFSDVKIIYTRTVREAIDFYVKPEDQPMFGFKPESYNEKWGLFGQVIQFEDPAPTVSDSCMINFTLGENRYFVNGEFRPMKDNAVVRMIGSLYKLERRGHMRVNIERADQRDCNFILRGKNTVFFTGEILNLSQGGMKVRVPTALISHEFQTGEIVRTWAHINNKHRFEMEGVIKHSMTTDGDNFVGIQFTSTDDNDRRKLISLVMELQRRYSLE